MGAPLRPTTPGGRWTGRLLSWLPAATILTASFLVFSPALWNGFVNWDDPVNFTQNDRYRGLGWPQLKWMFTTFHMGHYQPVTWLTAGLTYAVWGMRSQGYFLVSITLHALNAAAFYLIARRLLDMAGARGRCARGHGLAFAAATATLFFALHPLRVEVVAWVTGQAYALAGLFCLVSLWAYLRAATEPASDRRYRFFMTAAVLAFALSLLSRAAAVGLPLVLMILDRYPLGRSAPGGGRTGSPRAGTSRLLLEKVPFIALAVGGAVLATVAKGQTGSLVPVDQTGPVSRLAIALYATAFYGLKELVPASLSPLYEMPVPLNPLEPPFVLCAVLVSLCTVILVRLRRRWPAALAAWLVYLALILPVSGLARVGHQIAADRYTYLACLSGALLAGGGMLKCFEAGRAGGPAAPLSRSACGLAIGGLGALGALTVRQIGVWRDSVVLWRQAIAATRPCYDGHYHLGLALTERSEHEAAIEQFFLARTYRPAECASGIGGSLVELGRYEEAAASLETALRIRPEYAEAEVHLGRLRAQQGRLEEAADHHTRALRINPELVEAYVNLANVRVRQARFAEAVRACEEALRRDPQNGLAHLSLGVALAEQGRFEEAIGHYRRAELADPARARNNAANALMRIGRVEEAIREYERALAADPEIAETHYNMGLALSQAGRTAEAIARYGDVLVLRPDHVEARTRLHVLLVAEGRYADAVSVLGDGLMRTSDSVATLNNLAWLLATCPEASIRNGQEAVRLARRACELTGHNSPQPLATLAAALAECGEYDHAVQTVRRAIQAANRGGQEALAEQYQSMLSCYAKGTPYRQD